jgi:hypothetical protein
MLLHRVTTNPFEGGDISSHNIGQHPDSLVAYTDGVVMKFDRFGNGARRSDFEVTINWSDIEQIITEFCRAKNPEALEFRAALKLSKALKETGWRPPEISN